MSTWQRLKRVNKQAAVFDFTFDFQELQIGLKDSRPFLAANSGGHLVITITHRGRKYSTRAFRPQERTCASTFELDCATSSSHQQQTQQFAHTWLVPEKVNFSTTLYKSKRDTKYEAKLWQFQIEYQSDNSSKSRILAYKNDNLSEYIQSMPLLLGGRGGASDYDDEYCNEDDDDATAAARHADVTNIRNNNNKIGEYRGNTTNNNNINNDATVLSKRATSLAAPQFRPINQTVQNIAFKSNSKKISSASVLLTITNVLIKEGDATSPVFMACLGMPPGTHIARMPHPSSRLHGNRINHPHHQEGSHAASKIVTRFHSLRNSLRRTRRRKKDDDVMSMCSLKLCEASCNEGGAPLATTTTTAAANLEEKRDAKECKFAEFSRKLSEMAIEANQDGEKEKQNENSDVINDPQKEREEANKEEDKVEKEELKKEEDGESRRIIKSSKPEDEVKKERERETEKVTQRISLLSSKILPEEEKENNEEKPEEKMHHKEDEEEEAAEALPATSSEAKADGGGEEDPEMSYSDNLMAWCRDIINSDKYPSLPLVENFDSSFRNGVNFCALIHHFHPSLIAHPETLDEFAIRKNAGTAFDVAANELGVPRLLTVHDVLHFKVPDYLNIITYLHQLRLALQPDSLPDEQQQQEQQRDIAHSLVEEEEAAEKERQEEKQEEKVEEEEEGGSRTPTRNEQKMNEKKQTERDAEKQENDEKREKEENVEAGRKNPFDMEIPVLPENDRVCRLLNPPSKTSNISNATPGYVSSEATQLSLETKPKSAKKSNSSSRSASDSHTRHHKSAHKKASKKSTKLQSFNLDGSVQREEEVNTKTMKYFNVRNLELLSSADAKSAYDPIKVDDGIDTNRRSNSQKVSQSDSLSLPASDCPSLQKSATSLRSSVQSSVSNSSSFSANSTRENSKSIASSRKNTSTLPAQNIQEEGEREANGEMEVQREQEGERDERVGGGEEAADVEKRGVEGGPASKFVYLSTNEREAERELSELKREQEMIDAQAVQVEGALRKSMRKTRQYDKKYLDNFIQLVNRKNRLQERVRVQESFRQKDAELSEKIERLRIEFSELQQVQDSEKSQKMREREEQLMQQLMERVEERNQLVEQMDRLEDDEDSEKDATLQEEHSAILEAASESGTKRLDKNANCPVM